MSLITGILALNNKDKGYVRPLQTSTTPSKKEDSIGIPPQFILDALPGDTVIVDTFPKPNKWGEIEGKITEIQKKFDDYVEQKKKESEITDAENGLNRAKRDVRKNNRNLTREKLKHLPEVDLHAILIDNVYYEELHVI